MKIVIGILAFFAIALFITIPISNNLVETETRNYMELRQGRTDAEAAWKRLQEAQPELASAYAIKKEAFEIADSNFRETNGKRTLANRLMGVFGSIVLICAAICFVVVTQRKPTQAGSTQEPTAQPSA